MSRRATGSMVKSFASEVRAGFASLAEEFGLTSEVEPDTVAGVTSVTFRAGDLGYRVHLVLADHGVFTTVILSIDNGKLVADLGETVVGAGLGSRQSVPNSAHTLRSMRRALSAQADWIRRLHAILISPEGPDLMRRSNARFWTNSG